MPKRFREAINDFINALKGFDVEVYLFGSLDRGDYLIDSDVDLIVVAHFLGGMKPWERTAYLRRLAPKNVGFDIISYTREEFKRAKRLFGRELVRIA